jgi:hypothetical protein
MEMPMSHHGAACPEVKNSAVLDPARRAIQSAGMNEATIEATMMPQSSGVNMRALISERVARRAARDGALRPAARGKIARVLLRFTLAVMALMCAAWLAGLLLERLRRR